MVKREKREFLLLLIFGAIILLAANGSLAITDPVESNYALTAKEMVASGDYLSPRIFGNYWYDKPAFFYWEMIASCLIFGVNEFALRLPSAVMGLLSLTLLYFFARRLYGHRTALLAGGLFASSVGFWYVGKAIITDMTLFFFMSATLVSFYLGYDSGKRVRYYAAFFFAGLAVLTKGPIGFLLPGLLLAVYLVLRKDAKELLRLRWGGGMILFLLVGGSWYYAMYSLHGADFLGTFFGTHNFLRATVSEHPRQNVWYYYILLFLASFFPWSLPLVWCMAKKIWQEKGVALRRAFAEKDTLFLLVWALGTILVYQCMATKYPTYTFPSLFPIAILAARLLGSFDGKRMSFFIAAFGILYLTLFVLVAVPMCRERGGAPAAALVHDLPAHVPVMSYREHTYSVGCTFYSDKAIYLLTTREDVERNTPKPGTWTATNIMPFYAVEDLSALSEFYVLCPKKTPVKDELAAHADLKGRKFMLCGSNEQDELWHISSVK
nr:glycosyltransferase family 39 protein [uncultured Selenomonas sp.]